MGFSVSIPPLPSMPTLRSFIETEPQVLYPVSATNTRPPSSPLRNGGGKCLPPVPDVWAGERGRTRRSSVATASSSTSASSLGLTGLTPIPASPHSGGRPTHRRSHSAVPLNTPSPLGKLKEYVRNPLAASTSALSLPTLAEIEGSGGGGPVLPPTSTRTRRGSRASIISTTKTVASDRGSVPPSPLRGVPASLPDLQLIVPPPPRARRPAPPARSQTLLDVSSITRTRPPTGQQGEKREPRADLTRHASFTRGHRHSKSRGSVGEIADVTVLATWSVPSSPRASAPAPTPFPPQTSRACAPASPAIERLASLSLAETLPPAASQRRPSHRSTHSSPNIVVPPLPANRPAPTRIWTQQATLGSSPGSLLSSSNTSSPTSSLKSLPPNQQLETGTGVGWRMPWGSRRGSVASILSGRSLINKMETDPKDGRAELQASEYEEVEEGASDEEYISYEDLAGF